MYINVYSACYQFCIVMSSCACVSLLDSHLPFEDKLSDLFIQVQCEANTGRKLKWDTPLPLKLSALHLVNTQVVYTDGVAKAARRQQLQSSVSVNTDTILPHSSVDKVKIKVLQPCLSLWLWWWYFTVLKLLITMDKKGGNEAVQNNVATVSKVRYKINQTNLLCLFFKFCLDLVI